MSYGDPYKQPYKPKKTDPLLKGLSSVKREVSESFRWLGDPKFSVHPVGKNKVRIKGVALTSDTISKNQRKYVEAELIRSARTLQGKPLTINHNPNKIVGNVELSDFEDGKLEYVAVVNKQPYVNYLRNSDPTIKGVSVEANYMHLICSECGQRFYSEQEFREHMETVHLKKHFVSEPHGINYNFLSLVVAPEEPGVDTTLEVMETKQAGLLRLYETVMKEEKMKENIAVSKTGVYLAKKSLGEPFADYSSFEDCVKDIMSKNPDYTREQAEGTCAKIEKQATGKYPSQE